MTRQLVASQTKFVCGARAYRVWIETDEDHPDIGQVFTQHIQNGRRVIFPEARGPMFALRPPVPLVNDSERSQPDASSPQPPERPAPGRVSAIAGIAGVHISDNYPDNEEPVA